VEEKMAKGKRYPNWKEKVKEWESSNKSTKIWCQENKIPYTTLCGWRNRLKKSDHNKISNKSVGNFIELKDQISSDPRIILEYQGVKIQLNRDFDKIVLKECLHCLRGALC
jgi:hypothetical protein